MNKEETCFYLDSLNIKYEKTEHKAVFNMDECKDISLPYPEWEAKNLFVRDDKKRNYYLISIKGDKKINLKEFAKENNIRPLSFASEEDLYKYLKLVPGSVTPLGLLNNNECNVIFFLDEEFVDHIIGCHPNENTATLWLRSEDLISVISGHGNKVNIIKIK